ncbi:MAG TPA: metallophosphoesterase family protein [Gaiellaceae bacterium]|nr:metallophosphoesterase family protein [Gaiellaceae bacterium]
MRVAALYDVHGLRLGLEAVLAEVGREEVDAIVFGGDLFLGPQPAETAELVRTLDASFIRGNCDREPDDWTRSKLDDETLAWSQGWPLTVELDGVLYCHASPENDMRPILTDASPPGRFEEALDGVDARLVVAGHTHMQFRRGRWANAGSVGWPAEDDVAAFWALVSDDVEFRRTPFDTERAAVEILATGWPNGESFVAENIRTPPSRAEATAWFESLQ